MNRWHYFMCCLTESPTDKIFFFFFVWCVNMFLYIFNLLIKQILMKTFIPSGASLGIWMSSLIMFLSINIVNVRLTIARPTGTDVETNSWTGCRLHNMKQTTAPTRPCYYQRSALNQHASAVTECGSFAGLGFGVVTRLSTVFGFTELCCLDWTFKVSTTKNPQPITWNELCEK